MPIFLKIILGLVVAIVGLIVGLRLMYARRAQALRDAISRYAVSRGGQVDFIDDVTFTVKGPLGEGRETTHALSIMCKPGEEERWEMTIGFALRKYIPDALHDALANAAAERLAEQGPKVEALSDDELRAKLRARIVRSSADRKGLATCARPLGEGFELRLVVDGVDLDGVPTAARERLPESDAELLAAGLDASLTDHPDVELGSGASLLWLARPEALWGSEPHVIVAEGEDLVWTPVEPGNVEARLAMLANKSCASGPLKNVMWAWDGHSISHSTVVVHTIIGPDTPDYTLKLPPAFHGELGIHPGPDGTFGVSRR